MKTLLWLRFLTIALVLLQLPAMAVPWVSRHNLTADDYQNQFTTWTSAPHNYRLISVSGYETSGQARFAAVWEKRPGPSWAARHQMTAATFETERIAYAQQGFYPTFISGFGVGSNASYNAIWEHLPGTDLVPRVGMTFSEYASENSANTSAGYKLAFLWTFNVGTNEYFNAIWRKGLSESYLVRARRTASQYQQSFDELAQDGYQLQVVSTAIVGGVENYSAIWKKPGANTSWYSLHGLSEANYQAETWNAYYQGYRPVFASTFNQAANRRFNVIFYRNGGMTGVNLGLINDAIGQYMQDNGVPGLSLAIARQGRLVYAKGFGMADQEAAAVVHPHHRFRAASVAKPITAAAVLRLDDQSSALALDQTVFGTGALLGTAFGTQSYSIWERAITVRHLLHHTTGWTSDDQLWNNAFGTDHAAIIGWTLDNSNPSSAPGTAYQYINLDYVVAGRVIERLTGKTYEQYVREEVLAPCCITDMEIGGQTLAQRKTNEVVYYGGNPYTAIHPGRMDANGGWIAKPMDLLLFLRRIDNDPVHPDILSSDSLTALLTGSTPNPGYGLGTLIGNNWWGHNGCMDGTVSFLVHRNDGLQFAVVANTRPAGDSCGWNLRAVVDNLVTLLDEVNAWPSYDLFPCVSPSFNSWLTLKFPREVREELQLQTSVWGMDADPDDDGLSNAMEAYFDLDPLRPNPSPFTVTTERNEFVVRWTRPAGDRGVELKPKFATSLNPRAWADGPQIRSVSSRPDAGDHITEETRVPLDAAPRHFQFFEAVTR